MGRVIEPFKQFFDETGSPVIDGWLEFFVSGTTTTQKDTFANASHTIANANPLQLDAAGRCPDVFGDGDYRVVLYRFNPLDEGNPGEQLQTFDPVRSELSFTAGYIAGKFTTWSIDSVYDYLDITTHNYLYYRSLLSANIGYLPTIADNAWERIEFLRYWNQYVTYNMGDLVKTGTGIHLSKINSNTSNDPDISPAYWKSVGASYPGFSVQIGDYGISASENGTIFILSSNVTAARTFSLPLVDATMDGYRYAFYNASQTYSLTIDGNGKNIWIESNALILEYGAGAELVYSADLDHWILLDNTASALGAQTIGTATTPVDTAHITTANIDTLNVVDMTGVRFPDNDYLYFGSDDDMYMVHTGLHGYIDCGTGDLTLRTSLNNSLYFSTNNTPRWIISGAGDLVPAATGSYDIGAGGAEVKDIYQGDSCHHYLGNDQDLDIYHSGSNGYIQNSIGWLFLGTITANKIQLMTNSVFRWEVTDAGHLLPSSAVIYDLGSTTLELRHIYQGDSCHHYLGNDQDLDIYHSGSNAAIINNIGNMYIRNTAAGSIQFETNNTSRWNINSSGNLLPNSTETYDIGASASRINNLYADNVRVGDNGYFYAGDGSDFYITHDGSISYLLSSAGNVILGTAGTGTLTFRTSGVSRWYIDTSGDLIPTAVSSYDVASATNRANTLYCVTLDETSDETHKEEIRDSLGLDFILNLSPKSYKMKIGKDKRRKHGLIAQDVNQVLADFNLTTEDFSGISKHEVGIDQEEWGISYSQFIAPIINAIKELSEQIKSKQDK